MKTYLTYSLLLGFLLLFSAYTLPLHWAKSGSDPDSYDMGIDPGSGKDAKNAATIKCLRKRVYGFGTLMQATEPGMYLGKRIRMSGWMKARNVRGWAGFWLRIDGDSKTDHYLSFDNMFHRPIRGNTDWTKYEIVLEVPKQAVWMAYGALLEGQGQIWFDQVQFDIVDTTVALTAQPVFPDAPDNLDFEK